MKIAIYVENFIAGGVDTVLANKINAWPIEDEIILLCNDTNDGLEKILKKRIKRPYELVISDILSTQDLVKKYSEFIPRFFLRAFFYYGRYFLGIYNCILIYFKLRKKSIDAIFIHNGGYPAADSARFIVWSSKLASIEHIFMVVHSFASPYKIFNKPFEYFLDRMVERNCKMVCVSQKCHDSLIKIRDLHNQSYVIYNGINPPEINSFSEIDDEIISIKESNYIIAMIAWFDIKKGHEDLFFAISILKERFFIKNIKCLIFGEVDDKNGKNKITELIQRYDVADNVCLMGFRPNVVDYLKYVDILVVPSKEYEGFSMAALEAIFQGVPTIISSICGISEILIDKISTYIVPPDSPHELAIAINAMLVDEEFRAKISMAAKEKICNTFDARKMSFEYKKLISEH